MTESPHRNFFLSFFQPVKPSCVTFPSTEMMELDAPIPYSWGNTHKFTFQNQLAVHANLNLLALASPHLSHTLMSCLSLLRPSTLFSPPINPTLLPPRFNFLVNYSIHLLTFFYFVSFVCCLYKGAHFISSSAHNSPSITSQPSVIIPWLAFHSPTLRRPSS